MCQFKCMVYLQGRPSLRFRRVCTSFLPSSLGIGLPGCHYRLVCGTEGAQELLRDMLIRLTRQLRVRGAIALAVVYSFCLIFPPVAFGFADGKLATHCLGMVLDRADSTIT